MKTEVIAESRESPAINDWLPRKDSNLDKEIQNLSCYHYTTRQNKRKT